MQLEVDTELLLEKALSIAKLERFKKWSIAQEV